MVAVGDVHGDYAEFVSVLRSAGLIDEKGRWTGGKAHLVQTGDVLDRGADSRKVMDLLMSLEKQAAKAGGRVHALIGNHEAMNLYGDLRYTTPGEFAAFRTDQSEKLRTAFWEREVEWAARPAQRCRAPKMGDGAPARMVRTPPRVRPQGKIRQMDPLTPRGREDQWLALPARRHQPALRHIHRGPDQRDGGRGAERFHKTE